MVDNAEIQQSWVTELKSNLYITARVPAAEIRENLWKGQVFSYPNIRVNLTNLMPTQPGSNCQIFRSEVSIQVFTEQKSSRQADEIAGVIARAYWGHPFTAAGVKFTAINLTNIEPAFVPEFDENSWQSNVNFSCLVQAA